MSGFCGRFSLGALYEMGAPINHYLPLCKTGAVHQVEVELSDARLLRAKPLDPLLAMYVARKADIRRELGGDLVLVQQDLFTKNYLHNCLIVSTDFQESVVYEKSKSPSIKMKYESPSISGGHFFILHLRPIVLRVGRELTEYYKKPNPMPVCDLSGAECIICAHPYDDKKYKRLQICAKPCAEGFHCLQCYLDAKDSEHCPVCRQESNPVLKTMTIEPVLEKVVIKETGVLNHINNDVIGWLGLAFHDEMRWKISLGVALMRRALSVLPGNDIFKDFESISTFEMNKALLRCHKSWKAYTNLDQFTSGSHSDMLLCVKALIEDEDARLDLLGKCSSDAILKRQTYCHGILALWVNLSDEKRLEKMEELKGDVIHWIKQKYDGKEDIQNMVRYIKRENKIEVIQL
jgi:hypothetical protein